MVSIEKDVSLAPYNTFHLPAKARLFARVKSVGELKELLVMLEAKDAEIMVLGGGSNVLLTQDFSGLVIKNEMTGIEVLSEDDDTVLIKAESGTVWHDLVIYAIEHGWGGIENLSLVPGSVGAAPMQNIGAYGIELKETFVELEALDIQTLETKKFTNEECRFGYRDSIFKNEAKGKYFILSITLKLSKHPQLRTDYGDVAKVLSEKRITSPTIKDVSDAVISIRKAKLPDPNDIGNAGSFFKNSEVDKEFFAKFSAQFPDAPHFDMPSGLVKIPAAWLIEQCGWKGKRVGNTGSHTRQALVLVNYGDATGQEIQQLAKDIISSVHEKFGITLTTEVNII
jgi:UDP-N-acetylmuramate dehydrogenase